MKKNILVARRVFDSVLERLRVHFEVETNQDDLIWSKAELIARLQGKDGAFITASERIDAELLAACPQLRAVCNMAVGYNNIDLDACTARGVLASNTPDVLTETTADFGFALMMAAARRMAEGEHFLRRGGPGCLRRRTGSEPGPVDATEHRLDPAYCQRHRQDPFGDGRPGSRQPDRGLDRRRTANAFERPGLATRPGLSF